MAKKFPPQLHPEIQYGGRQNGDQYRSLYISRIQSQHSFYGMQGRNYNCQPPNFLVIEPQDNLPEIAGCNRNMEIQDGGCQTANESQQHVSAAVVRPNT